MAAWSCQQSARRRPNSQRNRSRAQSRFSAFFHGYSVLTKERWPTSPGYSKGRRTHHPRHPGRRQATPQGALNSRSRTSTRSLIDPVSSPQSSTGIRSPQELWQDRGASFRPVTVLATPRRGHAPRDPQRQQRCRSLDILGSRRRGLEVPEKQHRRICFPTITNQLRTKILGSLISGALLVVILTICWLQVPAAEIWLTCCEDVALAVSNSVAGRNFHVVLIILTLIVTIVFCHYLIRLCMVFMQHRGHRQIERVPSQENEEGFARPRAPIRVILARDEELGFHDDEISGETREQVQHPPPAYGLWRSSVVRKLLTCISLADCDLKRADPNLIHWQRIKQPIPGRTPDLASHPANRPPSYNSDTRAEPAMVLNSPPPLFAHPPPRA